jgi:4-hydroxybenzoate adenylyltransferase
MNGNLVAKLHHLAVQYGWIDRPAYIVRVSSNTFGTYTYADVFTGARAAASVLATHRVGSGDRVLLALPDGVAFVRAYLAVLHVGAVAVLANPFVPTRELAKLVDKAAPTVAIGGPALARAAETARILDPSQLAGDPDDAPPVAERAPDDDAYALFTSGTTGDPKMCFHTHADPLVYDQAFGKPVLGLRPGTVVFSVSKSFFAYGLGNSVFYPLLSGATAVLEPLPPTEESVLAAVRRFGVSVLFAVPSMYARLLAHPSRDILRSVQLAVCAGEVLPVAVTEGMTALGRPVLLNGIGSTEVGQTFASNTVAALRDGTVGKALPPYQIRVVDEANGDVAAGMEGALLVKGPTVSPACASAADRAPRRPAEWHPTGDVVTIDEDGYIRVIGRVDDVEIVGGVNVHPTEVEDMLARHPQVADVAVCAVTDAGGVSRLIAYVKSDHPREGLGAELIDSMRGSFATEKVPSGVVFVPGLPRTPTGKLQRWALREAAARLNATGSWLT